MPELNPWAVLLAATAGFALGGLWYSPALFMQAWLRAAGTQPDPSPRVYAVSFALSVLAAGAFAAWLGPRPPLGSAVLQGLGVGLCIVAASIGVNYQFASRPSALWLIDGGFHAARFTLFGAVLGLWH